MSQQKRPRDTDNVSSSDGAHKVPKDGEDGVLARIKSFAERRGMTWNEALQQRLMNSFYFQGYPAPAPGSQFASSNQVLDEMFDRYYAHFGMEDFQLEVDIDKKDKTKLWGRLVTPGQNTRHATVWTPRMYLHFPKAHPFGNRQEDWPKASFTGTSFGGTGAYKYQTTITCNLGKDESTMDPVGQHFCHWMEALTLRVTKMIWTHDLYSAAPRTAASELLKSERETMLKAMTMNYESRKAKAEKLKLEFNEEPPEMEPITEEDLWDCCKTKVMHRVSRLRSEKDDPDNKSTKAPRHEVPFTHEVRASGGVFSEVFDVAYAERLREQANKTKKMNDFIRSALFQGKKTYKYNDLPMYDAANLRRYPKGHAKAGQMIPIPWEKRKLGHGDQVSLLLRLMPYENNPQGNCGVYAKPTGILFFKRGPRGGASDADASMPTKEIKFDDTDASGYTELVEAKEDEAEEETAAEPDVGASSSSSSSSAAAAAAGPTAEAEEDMNIFGAEDDGFADPADYGV